MATKRTGTAPPTKQKAGPGKRLNDTLFPIPRPVIEVQATQDADRRIEAINEGRLLRVQVITSGTSITSHAEARFWRVRMVGGGGSGGDVSSGGGTLTVAAGGGGGAGAYAESTVSVSAATAYTCAIGAAGSASAGGNTTLTIGATTITCPGGPRGQSMVGRDSTIADALIAAGSGNSSVATNASDVNTKGDAGQPGAVIAANTSLGWSGSGGSGPLGSGGSSFNLTNFDGLAASGYGAGGGGSAMVTGLGQIGGVGTQGVIVVEEYA